MFRTPNEVAAAVNELADAYRARCLWFLRADYYPTTDAERIVVLRYIEKHGDRAYRRAAAIRQWLSRNSSAASAAS